MLVDGLTIASKSVTITSLKWRFVWVL